MTDVSHEHPEIIAIVRKLSDAVRGDNMTDIVAALATFQTFMICAISDTKQDAIQMHIRLTIGTTESINKKYEDYHADWKTQRH